MKNGKTNEDSIHRLSWCTERDNAIILSIKVQPRASKNSIILPVDKSTEFIKITITAPPVDSEANNKLVEFLSDILDRPKSSIQIIKGHTSKMKIVAVYSIKTDEFLQKVRDQ
ncbi:MAG: DUF167 domain-containing protein [Verrucomicrobiia bacterium]